MIEKLIKYASKEGFAVRFNAPISKVTWDVGYKPDTIYVRSHRDSSKEVYDFLHELGHYIINKDRRAFAARYPASAYAEEMYTEQGITKYKRRNAYKVDCIREEYDAWESGLDLARKLRLDIDEEDYRNYGAKNVYSYVKYYGKK